MKNRENLYRRGTLLAELFLQDLEPRFVAGNNNNDLGFDYFVGFDNQSDGLNVVAVEVKVTEGESAIRRFRMHTDQYIRLSNMNIPALLLVVNVKMNHFYFANLSSEPRPKPRGETVSVPVVKVTSKTRETLTKRLSSKC